jgi:hypothetical protein
MTFIVMTLIQQLSRFFFLFSFLNLLLNVFNILISFDNKIVDSIALKVLGNDLRRLENTLVDGYCYHSIRVTYLYNPFCKLICCADACSTCRSSWKNVWLNSLPSFLLLCMNLKVVLVCFILVYLFFRE